MLTAPLSTPCGHTFCKARVITGCARSQDCALMCFATRPQACLEAKFAGVADTRDRAAASGRAMREAKIVKPCPACKFDLAEFLKGAQVNTDMAAIISNLQRSAKRLADGEDGEDSGDPEEKGDEQASRTARCSTLGQLPKLTCLSCRGRNRRRAPRHRLQLHRLHPGPSQPLRMSRRLATPRSTRCAWSLRTTTASCWRACWTTRAAMRER